MSLNAAFDGLYHGLGGVGGRPLELLNSQINVWNARRPMA